MGNIVWYTNDLNSFGVCACYAVSGQKNVLMSEEEISSLFAMNMLYFITTIDQEVCIYLLHEEMQFKEVKPFFLFYQEQLFL
jgi:hypothetical protein